MVLNAKQQKAIILLAEGMSNKAVGDTLSIAHETISRWRARAEFNQGLTKALEDNLKAAQERLRSLAGTALDTIEEIIKDKDAPTKERLTASLKVIELINLAPPPPTAIEITTNTPRSLSSFYDDRDELRKAIIDRGLPVIELDG